MPIETKAQATAAASAHAHVRQSHPGQVVVVDASAPAAGAPMLIRVRTLKGNYIRCGIAFTPSWRTFAVDVRTCDDLRNDEIEHKRIIVELLADGDAPRAA